MPQTVQPAAHKTSKPARAVMRFLDWWGRELAALIPQSIRNWWNESDHVLLLRFDEAGNAVFERETKSGRDPVLSINATAMQAAASSPGNTTTSFELARRMNGKFRLWLCLGRGQILCRSVTLPLAVEENLRQSLAFEIDRYTPFKLDQVYFDYRIADRNLAQRKIVVELAVAKRVIVDHEIERANALGLPVNGVMSTDNKASPETRFNLLPNDASGSSGRHILGMRLLLLAFSLLMLATLLGIPVWQKRAAAISLLAPLAEAKLAASETDRMRDRLDIMVAEYNLLPDRKWQDASALMVLAELSKLLPDDSFVTVLDYDGKSVQIQGESTSAAALVEILDASPMFKDVGFKAPVAKIQGTAYDRYHLSAILDLGARPKPVPTEPTPEPVQARGEAQP